MSWQLISRSFAILRSEPKLLLFPLLSGAAGAAIVVLYALSPAGSRAFGAAASHALGTNDAIGLLLAYWLLYFVMIFFNCALAACAQAKFAGREMSFGDGLAQAASKVVPILMWSLLSSTVGILMRTINERVGILGKIAVWLFSAAWNLTTFLVIPVLIIEDVSAIEALRRSGNLLRKTWGEQITVGIGIGWIALILAIPGVVLGAVGANYYRPVLALAVLYFVTLVAVLSAVRGVFNVALYRYATAGEVEPFPPAMLHGAFVTKKRLH